MIKKVINKSKLELRKLRERTLPRFFYTSGLLSSFYYFLFSSAFRREHQAVLAGKVYYEKEEKNFFLLVRNIHRIEKGLLMRPRKPVFAKSYIKETVDTFGKVLRQHTKEFTAQYQWFYDVLSEYFKVVDKDKKMSLLEEDFRNSVDRHRGYFEPETGSRTTLSKPYLRNSVQENIVSYDDFYALTRHRRSVRWFLEKPVPRELLDKAILAANQSPSACNRQPFEYRIIDQKGIVREAVDLPMGTTGYGANIPVFIIVVGNLNAYFSERDRHLIYVDASLANMSLMLALETLGLSSCPINWPDIESREKKMDKFLGLKKHQRVIMCLGVGYPDPEGKVAFSEKRDIEEIRKYQN